MIGNYDDPETIMDLMKSDIAGEISESVNYLHDTKEGLVSYISNELDDLEDNEKEYILSHSIVPY